MELKMTMFQKDMFESSGECITYFAGGERSKFVARFKYVKSNKASFISFLIKNFTVEEYFDRLDTNESPLTILESKGYIPLHIKRALKQAGYPQTAAGKAQYITAQIAARSAR
jgi:hypothetical protein